MLALKEAVTAILVELMPSCEVLSPPGAKIRLAVGSGSGDASEGGSAAWTVVARPNNGGDRWCIIVMDYLLLHGNLFTARA